MVIQSPAAPQEIVAELTRSIDRERPNLFSSSGFGGDEGFVGHIDGQRFRIQRRQKNHNGFAPQAYGNVFARDGGAAIDYTISVHRTTKLGAVMFIVFFALMGAAINFGASPPSPGSLSPALWTLLALGGGTAFVVIARLGWDSEVAALHRFISEVSDRAGSAGHAIVS